MPNIPLHQKCIASPTRLDLAAIEAVMLWPDDEAARKKGFDAALARHTADRISQLDALPDKATISDLVSFIADATPIKDIAPTTRRPFRDGLFAGMTLNGVLGLKDSAATVTLGTAMTRAIEAIRTTQLGSFDQSNAEKIWSRMRPVAHLWGACLATAQRRKSADFPCQVRDLPDFIAFADLLLRQGTKHAQAGGRRKFLLDRSEAWHPGPTLIGALPERFEFEGEVPQSRIP